MASFHAGDADPFDSLPRTGQCEPAFDSLATEQSAAIRAIVLADGRSPSRVEGLKSRRYRTAVAICARVDDDRVFVRSATGE